MERDVAEIKKLLKRLPCETYDLVLKESRQTCREIISKRIKLLKLLDLQFVAAIWKRGSMVSVCVAAHNSSIAHEIKFSLRPEILIKLCGLKIYKNKCTKGPEDEITYDGFENEIRQMLGVDTFDGVDIDPACPLLQYAKEIYDILRVSPFYTALTLLCIHRWRKESLVARLPRDLLIDMLKKYIL